MDLEGAEVVEAPETLWSRVEGNRRRHLFTVGSFLAAFVACIWIGAGIVLTLAGLVALVYESAVHWQGDVPSIPWLALWLWAGVGAVTVTALYAAGALHLPSAAS